VALLSWKLASNLVANIFGCNIVRISITPIH
jgi:hypothetical protein